MIWFQTILAKQYFFLLRSLSIFHTWFQAFDSVDLVHRQPTALWLLLCKPVMVDTLTLRKHPVLCSVLEIWGSNNWSNRGHRLCKACLTHPCTFQIPTGKVSMGCTGVQSWQFPRRVWLLERGWLPLSGSFLITQKNSETISGMYCHSWPLTFPFFLWFFHLVFLPRSVVLTL